MQNQDELEQLISDLQLKVENYELQPESIPIDLISSQIIGILIQLIMITLLEVGIRRSHLWKTFGRNIVMFLVGCALYWFVGFDVMYDSGSSASSYSLPASISITDSVFQTILAATFIILFFPLINQHFKLITGIVLVGLFGSFLYPMAGQLSWGGGFLSELNYSDFSGSMLIYGVVGAAYIVFSLLSKPFNRRDNPAEKTWPLLVVMVLFILISISQAMMVGDDNIATISRFVAVAGLCAGFVSIIAGFVIERRSTFSSFCLGYLSATALLSGGIDLYPPFTSMALGAIAAIIFQSAKWGLQKLEFDDPAHLGAAFLCPAIVGGLIPMITELFSGSFLGQIVGVVVYAVIGAFMGLLLYVSKRVENACSFR